MTNSCLNEDPSLVSFVQTRLVCVHTDLIILKTSDLLLFSVSVFCKCCISSCCVLRLCFTAKQQSSLSLR